MLGGVPNMNLNSYSEHKIRTWPYPVIAKSSGDPPYDHNSHNHTGNTHHNSRNACVHPPYRATTQ